MAGKQLSSQKLSKKEQKVSNHQIPFFTVDPLINNDETIEEVLPNPDDIKFFVTQTNDEYDDEEE